MNELTRNANTRMLSAPVRRLVHGDGPRRLRLGITRWMRLLWQDLGQIATSCIPRPQGHVYANKGLDLASPTWCTHLREFAHVLGDESDA